MLQELFESLPDCVFRISAPVAAAVASGGLVLSLFGARFSRTLLALSLVAAGTVVGLRLPAWFGWHIDPMGTAFGAAILLGITGFMLSRLWEGVFLGALLAAWAGAFTWITWAPGASWQIPPIDWSATAVDSVVQLYRSLPTSLNHALPVAWVIGCAVGGLVVALWPKLGRVLLYSVAGTSAFLIGGTLAVYKSHPMWLLSVPTDAKVQAAILGTLLLLAAAIQWFGLSGKGKGKSSKRSTFNPPSAGAKGGRSHGQAASNAATG